MCGGAEVRFGKLQSGRGGEGSGRSQVVDDADDDGGFEELEDEEGGR